MTEKELNEVLARAEAATPVESSTVIAALATALHLTYEICEESPNRADDARQQIAAARTAHDKMAAEHRALCAEVVRLRGEVEQYAPSRALLDELRTLRDRNAKLEAVAEAALSWVCDSPEWLPEEHQLLRALRAVGYSPTEGGGA